MPLIVLVPFDVDASALSGDFNLLDINLGQDIDSADNYGGDAETHGAVTTVSENDIPDVSIIDICDNDTGNSAADVGEMALTNQEVANMRLTRFWHRRLGHPHVDNIRKTLRAVRGAGLLPGRITERPCDVYNLSKSLRYRF